MAGGNYPISGWKSGFLAPERLPLSGFSENRVWPASLRLHRHLENTRKGRSSSPLLVGQVKNFPRFGVIGANAGKLLQAETMICDFSHSIPRPIQLLATGCLLNFGRKK